jgi:hypothetical protein
MVDCAFMEVYNKCLHTLCLNHTIAYDWQMLLPEYQGLGLPNMPLNKLAISIQYLQHHWGSTSTTSSAISCVFKLVQVEVGLQGHFLLCEYSIFHSLATSS